MNDQTEVALIKLATDITNAEYDVRSQRKEWLALFRVTYRHLAASCGSHLSQINQHEADERSQAAIEQPVR